MNFHKPNKVGSIPFDHLSYNLKAVLLESLNCEKHKDKKIEPFCKIFTKAVCEKCIVESHAECQSQICIIKIKVQRTITDLQKRLHDNIADMMRVGNIRSKAMEKQKTIEDNMKMKKKRWSQRCSEILKNTTDEVEIQFQNKANGTKQTHEKIKVRLQEISASQGQVQSFLYGATSVHNKVSILRTAHKVRESIQHFQNDVIKIEKEVHDTKDSEAENQYVDFFKTVCNKLNDDSISDNLSSDKKGSDNLRQGRRQNNESVQCDENGNEKLSCAKVSDDEISMIFLIWYEVQYRMFKTESTVLKPCR